MGGIGISGSRALEAFAIEAERGAHDGKVMEGKDGWLFLAHDTNAVLEQHSGERRFSDFELEQWQLVLEQRFAWTQMLGCSYFMLVPPNPQSIYPEKLPESVPAAEERPVIQLMRRLADTDSFARILYPLEELRARKSDPIYPKTDTHWSALGAFVAYSRLVDEIEKVADVRRVTRDELRFDESLEVGDLGGKLRPQVKHVHLRPRLRRESSARLLLDNCVGGNGTLLLMECEDAPPTRCVVFGDSYSYMLLHYLSEGFRRTVFVHSPTVDFELLRRERPDVVISVMAERFLIRIPYDLPAPSVRELERAKKERGSVRGPVTSFWDFRHARLSTSLREVAEAARGNPSPVSSVLVRDVRTIPESALISEAATEMAGFATAGIPVIDEAGRVTGMLTRSHLLRALAEARDPQGAMAGELALKGDVVLDIDDTLERAVEIMRTSGLKLLPVTRNGALVGTVSKRRIDAYLQLLADAETRP
jgi:CBS domain-containing protein